jgi:hypothetical protein
MPDMQEEIQKNRQTDFWASFQACLHVHTKGEFFSKCRIELLEEAELLQHHRKLCFLVILTR